MLTTLLGLVGIGGLLAWVGLAPKVFEIVLEIAKAAVKGIVSYLGTLWTAISTATFAHWTLVLTAFAIGYFWSISACTALPGLPEGILGSSGYSAPAGRGAVSTTPDVYMSVKDIFCYWFGCM
jgi:hypothetical protein